MSLTRPTTAAAVRANTVNPMGAALERAITKKITQKDQFGNYFMVQSLKQMQKNRGQTPGLVDI